MKRKIYRLSGILLETIIIIVLITDSGCQEAVTNQKLKANESSLDKSENTVHTGPPLSTSLGYGFLCITLVNLSALLGVIFTVLKKYSFFPTLLSFMVATAVGSLLSTSIIVLIPEALEIVGKSDDNHPLGGHWYVTKSIAICAGVLFFYILEFLLRLLPRCFSKNNMKPNCNPSHFHDHNHLSYHQQRKTPTIIAVELHMDGDKDDLDLDSTPSHQNHLQSNKSHIIRGDTNVRCDSPNEDSMNHLPSYEELSTEVSKPVNDERLDLDPSVAVSPHTMKKRKTWAQRIRDLEPVGWMIFIGDSAHNFMDGLSIGVGFSQNIGLGISLTLAVLCEEIPHELGDIAVLLRSGLNVPLAMVFNFASACTAYIGFFIGISVGELSHVAPYVFAVTAGFFLYIALADMLPEMRAMEDAKRLETDSIWGIFLTNLAGLTFGFGCIITITLTSQYINIG
ncbi:unnamed protein product [Heterobilharzia americana]|nr:unnamed protein product [Heterobilharzia americana]